MCGKNALWVAKQHGHSIATMFRAYAAWAEGAAEVDVEAIKRSMNEEKPPTAIILAADLSVARAIHSRGAPASAFVCIPRAVANPLTRREKTEEKRRQPCMAGVAGLFGPRTGLTPSGPPSGRYNNINFNTSDHDAARQITHAG